MRSFFEKNWRQLLLALFIGYLIFGFFGMIYQGNKHGAFFGISLYSFIGGLILIIKDLPKKELKEGDSTPLSTYGLVLITISFIIAISI